MIKRILIFLCAVCFLNSLFALDGKREGFLLGFGCGLSNTVFSQEISGYGENIESDDEKKTGLATDFKIGYAPNNKLELYYSNRVAWFSMKNSLDDEVTIANGLSMLGASYFLAPELKTGAWHSSIFISAGIGLSSWYAPFEEDSETWEGGGYSLGVGYEFSKHFRISLDYFATNPSIDINGVTLTTNSSVFIVTFNALAF